MAEMHASINLSFFLSFENVVRRVTASLQNLYDLNEIAYDQFKECLLDSPFKLYVQDEEVENISQLFHGEIVVIRTKSLHSYSPQQSTQQNYSSCNSFDDHLKRISPSPYIDDSNIPNMSSTPCSSDVSSSYTNLSSVENKKEQNNDMDSDNGQYPKYVIPENGYYIHVTGVPYDITEPDIRRFFYPLNIVKNGIFCTLNTKQLPIGDVFVVFESLKDFQYSLQKNRQRMGGRYVEVRKTNLREFEHAVKISEGINFKDFFHRNSNQISYILKLKGFSFEMDEIKIRDWLNQANLNPDGIYVIYDDKNRNSGVAYLEYKNDKHSANRTFCLNNEYLGKRYINIYKSSVNELKISLAESIGSPLPNDLNPYLHCVKIENVPFNVSKQEIIKIFEPISVFPKDIFIKKNHNNRTNTAYLQFKNQCETFMALTRNCQYLGDKLIYLMQVSKYEFRCIVGAGDHGQLNDYEHGNNVYRSAAKSKRNRNRNKKRKKKRKKSQQFDFLYE